MNHEDLPTLRGFWQDSEAIETPDAGLKLSDTGRLHVRRRFKLSKPAARASVSYEKIARFYDAVMGDRTETADYVRYLIAQHKPDAKSLLDLACGTGAVLKILARSYEVAGLDASREMLSIARKKLPRVRLLRRDMIGFDLGRRFDVIVCVFDSINHVLRFADWRKIFRAVGRHLNEDGVFIFDVNTIAKLQRHIRTPPHVHRFGKNCVIMNVTEQGRGVAGWNIKVFARTGRGSYRVFEEDIPEVAFPVNKIRAALGREFARIKVLDPMAERPSAKSDRLYFVCRR